MKSVLWLCKDANYFQELKNAVIMSGLYYFQIRFLLVNESVSGTNLTKLIKYLKISDIIIVDYHYLNLIKSIQNFERYKCGVLTWWYEDLKETLNDLDIKNFDIIHTSMNIEILLNLIKRVDKSSLKNIRKEKLNKVNII